MSTSFLRITSSPHHVWLLQSKATPYARRNASAMRSNSAQASENNSAGFPYPAVEIELFRAALAAAIARQFLQRISTKTATKEPTSLHIAHTQTAEVRKRIVSWIKRHVRTQQTLRLLSCGVGSERTGHGVTCDARQHSILKRRHSRIKSLIHFSNEMSIPILRMRLKHLCSRMQCRKHFVTESVRFRHLP